jgi:hypothetical protein
MKNHFQGFKKVSSTPHMTVLKHPDGHEIRVAHAGLSDDLKDKIQAMPQNYDEGTPPEGAQNPELAENDVFNEAPASMIPPSPPPPSEPPLPEPNPDLNAIADRKKFYMEFQSGIYGHDPDLAEKKAQEDVLRDKETTANKASYEAQAQSEAAKVLAQKDMDYNDRAAKFGLPLRQIPGVQVAGPGAPTDNTPGTPQNDSDNSQQATTTPTSPGAPPSGASLPQTAPSSPQDYLSQAYQNQVQSITAIGQAKQAEFDTDANAQQANLEALQKAQVLHQQEYDKTKAEMDTLYKKASTEQIDPNRYWGKARTGNQVLSGISLLLGGLGAGNTGQNAALPVIQKAIDRDIEAQKANMGNTHNLLSQNLARLGDSRAAELQTRMQYNAITQAMMAKAAAKSGSAQAAASIGMQKGQLQQQMIPLANELAMYKVQSQMVGNGPSAAGNGVPIDNVPTQMKLDPRYVEVNGKGYLTADKERANDLKEFQQSYTPITNNLSRLDALGPGALVPGSQENATANALRATVSKQILSLGKSARMSPEAIKLAQEQFDNPTSFREMLHRGAASSVLKQNLDDELDARLRTNIPSYKGVGSYTSFQPLAKR